MAAVSPDEPTLICQRHLFSIEDKAHYLNCAAYSPLLKSSQNAGMRGMELKCNPQYITGDHHFIEFEALRNSLNELVNGSDCDRIAIFPSVSYGMAIVAKNINRIPNITSKKNIVIIQDEFPNDVYAFGRSCEDLSLSIKMAPCPSDLDAMGQQWNQAVIDMIDDDTALVVVPHVHWIYGVVFNLQAISEKCHSHGALIVIDGSQSIGALPFDVQLIEPDAVICAGYKWLFGPYSISFGYFGSFFDDGIPLEESWMNRMHSNNFSGLTTLQYEYRPKAQRYNMGEFSNFIYTPMLIDSIKQILEWKVCNIRNYIINLSSHPLTLLRDIGCRTVSDDYRAPHLFGVILPNGIDIDELMIKLKQNNIYVSKRSNIAIRVSLNVYNDENDLMALVTALRSACAY